MEKFQGFKPYIDMFDAGQLKPGQTIVVVRVSDFRYQVLPLDPKDDHPVYRVHRKHLGGDTRYNIRNLLKGQEWYVEETSTEQQ